MHKESTQKKEQITGSINFIEQIADAIIEKIKGGALDEYLSIVNTPTATAAQTDNLGNPIFLSVSQVQEMFSPRMGRTTLYNLTVKGILKSYELGGLYYKRSEIIAAVESGEVKRYKRHY